VDHDFDEAFSGININRAGWDASVIGGLDNSLPVNLYAEECQVTWSISAGAPSCMALYDIPWFRFQQWITTTGP